MLFLNDLLQTCKVIDKCFSVLNRLYQTDGSLYIKKFKDVKVVFSELFKPIQSLEL